MILHLDLDELARALKSSVLSWHRENMEYSLDRPKFQVYSTEDMVRELRRVALHYGNRRFSRRDYDAVASTCKGSAILCRFGSWQAALDATGLSLEIVGKNRWFISDQQLFEEMGRIWSAIGHRPSHDEWVSKNPRHSYSTYKARFGGWVNACAAFINFVTGEPPQEKQKPPSRRSTATALTKVAVRTTNSEKRNVSEKLRYRVLARDHFKCVLCGRSPASEAGVKLHIDHVIPFSRGGKTEFENLRSVCSACNWGKGADIETAL